jgi:hypothetical protein
LENSPVQKYKGKFPKLLGICYSEIFPSSIILNQNSPSSQFWEGELGKNSEVSSKIRQKMDTWNQDLDKKIW